MQDGMGGEAMGDSRQAGGGGNKRQNKNTEVMNMECVFLVI